MSSTKIDVTQIDLPGNPNELLAGDGSAVTVGSGLTLAGGVVTNTNPTPAPLATAGTPGLVELGGGLGGPGSTATEPVLDLNAPHVSGTVPSANLPVATSVVTGVVQLLGGLGGTGSTAFAPVLDVSSPHVSGTLPAANLPAATAGAIGGVELAGGLGGTGSTATAPVLDLSSPHVSGTVPSANLPAASAGTLGTVQLAGGLGGVGSMASAPVLDVSSPHVSGSLPSANQDPQTLGGDLSGTTASATVEGLQGNPVSSTAPTSGQALAWTGSAWAPATIAGGGGGGGGFVYYLVYSTAGQAPVPTAPPTTEQLTLDYTPTVQTNTGAVALSDSPTYTALSQFITDLNAPGENEIPGGLWDLNFYAQASAGTDDIGVRFVIQTWNGTTATTVATSSDVPVSSATISQYSVTVFVPPTALTLTDRIIIRVEGTKYVPAARSVTLYFEGSTVAHVHTSFYAPGGTGLVKVVNGVLQSPASLLVNADVSNTAAIAGSKLQAASAANAGSLAATDFNRIIASGDVTVTSRAATVTALQNQPVTGGAAAGQYLRFSGAAYTPTTVLYGSSAELAAADGSTVTVGANLTLAGSVLSGPSTKIRNVLFVTIDGNDGTADGSINLPFNTLQGAHDYAASNFHPEDHVLIAIAPGSYKGDLTVTRARTHFAALETLEPTDGTVTFKTPTFAVDCSTATSTVDDVVSFSGLYLPGAADESHPIVYITGSGLFAVVFDACTIQSNSDQSTNYAIFCDNIPASGQSLVTLRDCHVTSTFDPADSVTIRAERGQWSIVDSNIVNLSTKTGIALAGTEDSTIRVEGSHIEARGSTATVLLAGTSPVYPEIKLYVDDTTIANLNPGDGSPSNGITLKDKNLYVFSTSCLFDVRDTATSYAIDANSPPAYVSLGNDQYTTNRLVTPTTYWLNEWTIQQGGTGAQDKTTAFNNLSPLAAIGDLVAFDGTDNVALPVGANGFVLTADSAQPTGLKWAAATGGVTNVTASTPLASSGGTTPNISLTGTVGVANGGTGLSTWTAAGRIAVAQTATTVSAVAVSGDGTLAITGALTVSKINGSSVPAGGALTTGNVLQVNGASSLTYGALNLAGGSNYVTGVLPLANHAGPATANAFGYTSTSGVWNSTGIAGTDKLVGFNGSTPSGITVGSGLSLSAGTLTATGTGTVTSVTASAPLASSGGATPNVTLTYGASGAGGAAFGGYVGVTTTYSILTTDYVVNCVGTFTVTLPTAVGATGRVYVIKNSGTGTVTIATTSSQTIDGSTTIVVSTQYAAYTVMSNGANWIII